MNDSDFLLKETLSQLGLSQPADKILSKLKPQGYAEPDFLMELFQTERAPLLQDMREACQLSNADFAKMSLRFPKVFKAVSSQYQSQGMRAPKPSQSRYAMGGNEGGYNQVARQSYMQRGPVAQDKYRRGRLDSGSNSAKSSQEKEIEMIIDDVDDLNKKSRPMQRPVESDDETEESKKNRRKLCRRGYWVINKTVKQLCDQDKREKLEDQQRQIRYAQQATQYAAQLMAKPSEMAQKQRNIMVSNVRSQINEMNAVQGKQGGQVPQYAEHFPKLQREDREDNQACIPDFRPLPAFQFREPPPLRYVGDSIDLDGDYPEPSPRQQQSRQISSDGMIPPERNTHDSVDLNLDYAVFQDHGPQELNPELMPGETIARQEFNRKKNNPNQSAFIVTDAEPIRKMTYNLIRDEHLRVPCGQKKMDHDELIVINDKKKPLSGKCALLNRALAGHEVDQRTQMEATQHSLQMTQDRPEDGTQRLNTLFEKEIGVEDPEVYNKKEAKPGQKKERFMYGNPMEQRKMLNQLGILKKVTVKDKNSEVVNQIDAQASNGTTTVKPTLKLFSKEFVSYFELMKTVIEQKVFDNLGEVGRVMELTEQTGLRMIEWTLTRSDSSILTFRCKRYPLCQARVNFQMYVGGTDRVQLVSTHLKHCHQPDWTPKSRIDREVWAVLTHPNVQQKIAQTANKKYGDIDLCYFTAEESAIVENIDFSCVTREQFGKFMEIYHGMGKVGGTAPRRQLRSVQKILPKGDMAQVFERESQCSLHTQSQMAGQSLYAPAQSLLTANLSALPHAIDLDQPADKNQISIEDMSSMAVPQSNLNSEIPGGRLTQGKVQKVVNPPIIEFTLESFQQQEEEAGDQLEDLELFCQAAADTCPLAPNAKALVIQNQLRAQFGDSIEIYCSNDESMLFFTFSEQVNQAQRFMTVPGGSTMLVQSGFKTQMQGMSLMMFVCQAQSNMNFMLMAGCLIIETIAQKNQSRQVDYKWLFQAYQQSKLPQPSVCLTEFNEPFQRAMRKAWPKTQHLWSSYSIIRNGGKILVNQKSQQMEDGTKAIFDLFKTWIRNCGKTKEHFQEGYKNLKGLAKGNKATKMPIFLLYLKRIKGQASKWATFEISKGFDHVTCPMARRSQGSLFQSNQNLYFGDLLLVQKQKYIFKVVQQVLHKQVGLKLSQVIRAFEYLSSFSYQKQLLPVSNIKDPSNPPAPAQLASEQFISKACINLIESEIGKYFAQKMIGMASKLNGYKVQTHGSSHLFHLTQETLTALDENSVTSADSDMPTTQIEIRVTLSDLDNLLHCECNSVRLLGYPCVHILRVAAFRKQLQNIKKLDSVENYALQFEDVCFYFADHLGKSIDVDLLQFDASSAVTLDREKHPLAEVIFDNGQQLPSIDRAILFDGLIKEIKMSKLMGYKPSVIDIDMDSDQKERLRKSFGQRHFVKLSYGSSTENVARLEVLLALIQDLRAKNSIDVNCFNADIVQVLSNALELLDNKDFMKATEAIVTALQTSETTLPNLLSRVFSPKKLQFQTNRTCKGYEEKMAVNCDEETELPYLELSINDLQRHNFMLNECLTTKLTQCLCHSCPKVFDISQAPLTLFILLEGNRLLFEDLAIEPTFTISTSSQQYTYSLTAITCLSSVPQSAQLSSLLLNKPSMAETAKYDLQWPGWFFFSSLNPRARLFHQVNSQSDEPRNTGFAHALSQRQVSEFVQPYSKGQRADCVLKRHRKMSAYQKKFGVKPELIIYRLEKVEQVSEVMCVDLADSEQSFDNIAEKVNNFDLPEDRVSILHLN